ncbi:MAG TPA: hypothetical protein VM509_16010 [Planctomycetota bacterium]|nr:hypothetical protein [Planctomycetota bacterium]
MSQDTSHAGSARVGPAALAALVVAVVGAASVSMAKSMGYDEAMHAELPAARMLVAAQQGEWGVAGDTLQACQQYPFVYPVVLALVQAFTGVSELACRASGRVAWAIALFGIFLVAREVAAAIRREREKTAEGEDPRARWTPWIAFSLAALSPTALAYSGTLFLEVPFVAVAMLALYAWLRREGEQRARQDVVAGALLALALFTKFNYGGMLAAGCALDLALEGVLSARAGRGRDWIRSAARVALVPLVTCTWWFVLPWPGGLAQGASHREAFLGFLAGNQQMVSATFAQRLFDWGAGVFASPRALIVALLGALVALRFVRVRAARSLWIVGIVATAPVVLHPYHLDRLLLPSAAYLWILAAVGLGSLLPRRPSARAAVVTALLLVSLVQRDFDARFLMERGIPATSADPAVVAYREERLTEILSLAPQRALPTAGLPRAESDAALDALAGGAGDALRIGWLAAMEKMPPAALHVGLLARGGSPRRWLEDLVASMPFGVEGTDPGWDQERLAETMQRFDVVFSTDPPDAFGSGKWAFLAAYRERMTRELGFTQVEFARIDLQPPLGKPKSVRLLALRRSP